jgi:hypothetical protein
MKRIALITLATVLGLSCAGSNAAAPEGQPAIAFRRGGAWSTYSFALPRIVGPTAELELKNHALRGFINGGTVSVTIDEDGAHGFGPSGPVNLDVVHEGDELRVDGAWNGGPVHFTFSPERVSGSAVTRGSMVARRERSCGYDLDQRDRGGAFVGTAACMGMPAPALLAIDEPVARKLKPAELAVVLVAILASPPPSLAMGAGGWG